LTLEFTVGHGRQRLAGVAVFDAVSPKPIDAVR